jgi:RNA-binding protein
MLTSAQRKELKARAHSLEPVVIIGGKGLTAEVVGEIDRALKSHELIKVRAPSVERLERAQENRMRSGAAGGQGVRALPETR